MMETEHEVCELSRSVLIAIVNNRMAFARWAELCDCLTESDLPDYREAFDVAADASKEEILAAAMDAHYYEAMPCIESPFMDVLCSAYNVLDWVWIAGEFMRRLSKC